MIEVYEKQLFGERQRTTEFGANGSKLLGIVGVESLNHVEVADLGRILCGFGFLCHQQARSRNRRSGHGAGSAGFEQLAAGNLQFRHQFFSCFSVFLAGVVCMSLHIYMTVIWSVCRPSSICLVRMFSSS